MKVEWSLWRCVHPTPDVGTGECDVVVIQQEMESHLHNDHHLRRLRPVDVVRTFVLVRTAEVPRGPERRGTIDDETLPMFERGKDFR